jgi:hypothetical protein
MALMNTRAYGSPYVTIEKEKAKREPQRKEKLTALLNQRMHKAFGLTSSHPIIEDKIESFVANNQGDFSELKLRKVKEELARELEPEGIFLKQNKSTRGGSSAIKAGMGIVGIKDKPAPKKSELNINGQTGLSRGSKHSMSVKSFASSKKRGFRGSQQSQRTTSHRSLAESDEWREIQNFNSLLHLEEQNQEIQKERDLQRQMKEELDKQIREKRERERQEKEAERMYEEMQKKILKEADKKEKLNVQKMRMKIEKDKEGRDRQIIMENVIRKSEFEREKAQETIMMNKLKKELELEKLAFKQQKNVRKSQMKEMMAENTNAQYLAKIAQQREREEDEKIQREIMRKLEAQQMKEANDAFKRKQKQDEFVDKMATNVYSKIQERNRQEEEKINKYSQQHNLKQKLEEERRIRKQKQEQNDMKQILAMQMKDKKHKEEIDKDVIEEQAYLWRKDREQFEKQETEINKKMKQMNYKNAQLLQQQMDDHKKAGKGMDEIEYKINRGYLKGIRAKKHEILNQEE